MESLEEQQRSNKDGHLSTSSSQGTKKGVKRKASTSLGLSLLNDTYRNDESSALEVSKAPRTTRSGRPIRKVTEKLEIPPIAPNATQPKGKLKTSLQACDELLMELLTMPKLNKYTWPFKQPVDHVKLCLNDYLIVVKKPMDLSTLKVKMDHREYKSSSEFAEDMRLIYKNCYLYNPPDHPVVDMAKDFEQIFEKKFTEIPDTSESSEEDSGNERSEKVKFILQQINTVEAQIENLMNRGKKKVRTKSVARAKVSTQGKGKEMAKLKGKEMIKPKKKKMTKPTRKKNPKTMTTASNRMKPSDQRLTHKKVFAKKSSAVKQKLPQTPNSKTSFEMNKTGSGEKKLDKSKLSLKEENLKLITDIGKLSAEQLSKAIHVLRSGEPAMIENNPTAEITIEIESLKPSTLQALKDHVASSLNPNPNSSSSSHSSGSSDSSS